MGRAGVPLHSAVSQQASVSVPSHAEWEIRTPSHLTGQRWGTSEMGNVIVSVRPTGSGPGEAFQRAQSSVERKDLAGLGKAAQGMGPCLLAPVWPSPGPSWLCNPGPC